MNYHILFQIAEKWIGHLTGTRETRVLFPTLQLALLGDLGLEVLVVQATVFLCSSLPQHGGSCAAFPVKPKELSPYLISGCNIVEFGVLEL